MVLRVIRREGFLATVEYPSAEVVELDGEDSQRLCIVYCEDVAYLIPFVVLRKINKVL